MSRLTQWFVTMLMALLLQGCATGAHVRVDYDQKANFSALRSYAWAPMTIEERQEKSRNSLTHERIRSAVDSYLAAHGYAKVDEAQADFLVAHSVTVEQRTQVQSTQMSVGYGRYGARGGIGVAYGIPIESTVYQYKVGTLIIDIIDTRQKRLVWRASGERTLGEDLTPEERTKIIDTTVGEILGRFPPGSKSK
jgi:hypothetical protein